LPVRVLDKAVVHHRARWRTRLVDFHREGFARRSEALDADKPAEAQEHLTRALAANPNNSVIAFNDNSSSIRGAVVPALALEALTAGLRASRLTSVSNSCDCRTGFAR
jgi:hypothetical protein